MGKANADQRATGAADQEGGGTCCCGKKRAKGGKGERGGHKVEGSVGKFRVQLDSDWTSGQCAMRDHGFSPAACLQAAAGRGPRAAVVSYRLA